MKVTIIALLAFVMLSGGAFAQEQPADPAVEPVVEPAPAPEPVPVAEPVVEPAPVDEPVVEPAPAPEPAPVAVPASESATAPEPVPAPEPPPPAAIPIGGGDELLTVVNDLCSKIDSADSIMLLDSFAGPAIDARIAVGMYRDALKLVEGYSKCFMRMDVAGTPADVVRARLSNLACSLPFDITGADGSVDREAASTGFGMCRAPGVFAGGDQAEFDKWFESVRNYLELARLVVAPQDYVRAAGEYLGRIRAAAMTPAGDGMNVIANAVTLTAVTIGDIDAAISASGGETEACAPSRPDLLGLAGASGSGEADPILAEIAGKASFDDLFKVVSAGSQRFGHDCGLVGLAAGLALGRMTPDSAAALLAAGRLGDVALVVVAAPVEITLNADSATRVAVLERVVAGLSKRPATRAYRRCDLGNALLDAGRHAEADDMFAIARGDLPETEWKLAYTGRFLVALTRPGTSVSDLSLAARNLLGSYVTSMELVDLIEKTLPGRQRLDAVDALFRAAFASSAEAVGVIADVVVTILDTWPGSQEASRCVGLMDEYGVDDSDAEARASWLLLKARHELVAGDTVGGWLSLDLALRKMSAETPVARNTALPRLIFWMLETDRPDMAVGIVNRAVKVGAVSGAVVAAGARLADEKGFKKQSGALFRTARTMRNLDSADWLAIASVAVRMRNVQAAAEAIGNLGSEDGWGYMERMVRARFLCVKKDYGQCAAEFGKAVDLRPDQCEPIIGRAFALMMNGNAAAAEADLRACMKLTGPGHEIVSGLAWAVFDQKRFGEATNLFAAALSARPAMADYLVGMAMSMFKLGDVETARRYWNLAVAAQPLFSKGPVIAENAGFHYSAIQRKAWIDMRLVLGKRPAKGRK